MIIELHREDLYRKVWQHPVGPLSARLGMSSAKLREACKVMAIPIPPLGHWQRISAPPAPPLSRHDGPHTFVIGTASKAKVTAPLKTALPSEASAVPAAQAPRYVTLDQWAIAMFGDQKPHFNTLRKWVNEGRIQPQPKKMGVRWWVTPNAEYVED